MGRRSNAKERLLEAASVLFWQRSCGTVSVDTICKEAGVNKGSFYHFFESKTEIILAVIELAWDDLREKLLEPTFAPDTPPLERIERFFINMKRVQLDSAEQEGHLPGCRFCNLGSELSTLEESVRERIREVQARQVIFIQQALIEAEQQGKFNGSTSETASAIYALLIGSTLQAKIMNHINPLEFALNPLRQMLR